MLCISNKLMHWSNKGKMTVVKFSTEAEYVALNTSSQEVIWARDYSEILDLHKGILLLILKITKMQMSYQKT